LLLLSLLSGPLLRLAGGVQKNGQDPKQPLHPIAFHPLRQRQHRNNFPCRRARHGDFLIRPTFAHEPFRHAFGQAECVFFHAGRSRFYFHLPRSHPKNRRGSHRKDFCLGARSRATTLAEVLREERATKLQGKKASAQRVTANLDRTLRCSSVGDRCGYPPSSRLDSVQIRLVMSPAPTFRITSSDKILGASQKSHF